MTPNDVAVLVSGTATAGTVDEQLDLVMFEAILDNEDTRRLWADLRSAPPIFLRKITIRERDGDGHLEDGSDAEKGTIYQITVEKVAVPGILRVLFGFSIKNMEEIVGKSGIICVADIDHAAGGFTTYGNRFQAWTIDPPAPYVATANLPDPRRTTNDFTRRNTVTDDIRPWLLLSEPAQSSNAFETWKKMAARKLLAVISNQVSISDREQLLYVFSGPPQGKVEISDDDAVSLLPRLTDGGIWIFASSERDADTRHLLLSAEWARSTSGGILAGFGEGSLDSAKSAYAAYVKTGSKDFLKALADLRKSVIEESQKASQRAQELAGSLWKDLAIATTPFVIKVLPDAGKLANQWFALLFAIGAAFFLIFSIRMQISLNKRYFETQDNFRELWKARLNQVLSAKEVMDFSDTPIKESMAHYERAKAAICKVYIILVLVLAAFALYQATIAIPAQTQSAQQETEPSESDIVPPEPAEEAISTDDAKSVTQKPSP